MVHEHLADGGGNEFVPFEDRFDGDDQLFRRFVFHKITGGAVGHQFLEVLVILQHRKDEDFDFRIFAMNLFHGGQPVHVRHGNIGDHQIAAVG